MNINDNEKTSESQNKQIAAYLMNGNRLTQLDALRMFGCFRLASRVHDLRNKGLDVKTEKIILPNGKRICEYYIETSNN